VSAGVQLPAAPWARADDRPVREPPSRLKPSRPVASSRLLKRTPAASGDVTKRVLSWRVSIPIRIHVVLTDEVTRCDWLYRYPWHSDAQWVLGGTTDRVWARAGEPNGVGHERVYLKIPNLCSNYRNTVEHGNQR
jgi:hypothetical protein